MAFGYDFYSDTDLPWIDLGFNFVEVAPILPSNQIVGKEEMKRLFGGCFLLGKCILNCKLWEKEGNEEKMKLFAKSFSKTLVFSTGTSSNYLSLIKIISAPEGKIKIKKAKQSK